VVSGFSTFAERTLHYGHVGLGYVKLMVHALGAASSFTWDATPWLFSMLVVGSGSSILFWEDAWINGLTAEAIAPDLCRLVRPAVRSSRTVHDGLLGNSWARDISGELSVDAVVQYLRLWMQVSATAATQLAPDADDSFAWKWNGDGRFSSRSAYRMLFHGSTG
jgi:hypothetical protein